MPVFVAKNIENIPDRQPEELNLLQIINRLSQLEKKMIICNDTLTSHDNEIKIIKDNSGNIEKMINEETMKIEKFNEIMTCNNINGNMNNTISNINQSSNGLKCNEDDAMLDDEQQLRKDDIDNTLKHANIYNVVTGATKELVKERKNENNIETESNIDDEITLNELKTRLDKLRKYDDELQNDKTNETISDCGFEQFLDECDLNNINSFSVNEFINNRLSYGEVTKFPAIKENTRYRKRKR